MSREAPMGEVAIIPNGFECCLGQRMVLLHPDATVCNGKFLMYSLLSPFVQKQIKRSDTMVAPDKKTLKKSVKSMFFMVQTRCEVETIKY